MESEQQVLAEFALKTPGKTIISGEFSVIYGHPAFVMAINLYTKAQVKVYQKNTSVDSFSVQFRVTSDQTLTCQYKCEKDLIIQQEDQVKEIRLIQKFMHDQALSQVETRKGEYLIDIQISSQIPIGAGLGSSAAYSIALSSALLFGLLKIQKPTQEYILDESLMLQIQTYSDFLERIIHTNPSGVDVCISLNGGQLVFKRDLVNSPPQHQIKLLSQIKKESQLQMILVNTNKQRNSKQTIEAVMRFKEEKKDLFTQIIDQIGEITQNMIKIEEENITDIDQLLSLVSQNQKALQNLSVSCSEIEEIIEINQKFGYSSKLTGAGGGGCVIGFRKAQELDDFDDLAKELEQRGYSIFKNITQSKIGLHFELN